MAVFAHPSRTVLVTGATSGIGFALARRLADDGATVLMHARTRAEGDIALGELVKDGVEPFRLRLLVADFRRLSEVRALAAKVIRTVPGLDVLVNNAAIESPQDRTLTEDGHEITFQVNYLAPVLLTRALAGSLGSVGGRVVNVSSELHRAGAIGWNDPARKGFYLPQAAYSQSKLALAMFTRTLAEREHGELSAISVNPGTVATPLARVYGAGGRRPDEAADLLAEFCPPERPVRNGGYYNGREPSTAAAQVDDSRARARLAMLTDRLLGSTRGAWNGANGVPRVGAHMQSAELARPQA